MKHNRETYCYIQILCHIVACWVMIFLSLAHSRTYQIPMEKVGEFLTVFPEILGADVTAHSRAAIEFI